ncbi:hypothetical protein Nepgr_031347 [Nepenthes gracilis]|uniref:Uncharacterized protein n=1 Tax=Nepenthes gracilis TaxID=150966 RepID=A0AAD3Y6Z6_NEPGR|nr:hypothetical protein Nepgr_031347 [Nepenthes gracilis]
MLLHPRCCWLPCGQYEFLRELGFGLLHSLVWVNQLLNDSKWGCDAVVYDDYTLGFCAVGAVLAPAKVMCWVCPGHCYGGVPKWTEYLVLAAVPVASLSNAEAGPTGCTASELPRNRSLHIGSTDGLQKEDVVADCSANPFAPLLADCDSEIVKDLEV